MTNISPRESIRRAAVISEDNQYRYMLQRHGVTDDGNPLTMLAIGVNPSDADAERDDPTVVRLYGFCKTLGFGNLLVGNKFGRRSPDVKALRRAGDPIGPENDTYLYDMIKKADLVLACWGPMAKLPEALRHRWKNVVRLCDTADKTIYCLGTAADGHPRHPLMLPADTKLQFWPVPWFAGRVKGLSVSERIMCGFPAPTASEQLAEHQRWKTEQFCTHYGGGVQHVGNGSEKQ